VLDLEYAYRGDRTVLVRSSCSSPWHFLPPSELDDTRGAYTLLVNPSGGLVAGDHLTIRAKVGERAHALFSTPSANRIYRSTAAVARQAMQLEVGPHAIVEWVPETAIPYAGSRYAQTFEMTVARGGALWFWEAVANGRIARGERWAFSEFSSDIRIKTAAGERIAERMVVEPGRSGDAVGLAAEWNYVASAYLIADAVTEEQLAEIAEESVSILDSLGADVLGGISRPPISGLAMKIVARTSESLKEAMEGIWGVVRRRLWNQAIPPLRKY
jgi:urease accessory protein